MATYKIISVIIVDGKTLNKAWRSQMQQVTTDQGVFIDNLPGVRFGTNPPGSDWSARKGQSVGAEIKDSAGFKWIILVKDNLTTTSALAKILGIRRMKSSVN